MKSFTTFALVGLSALCLATSALASPVADNSPDPIRLDLARKILTANGGAQVMEQQMRVMFSGVSKLTAGNLNGADPKIAAVSNAMMNYIMEEEVKSIPELIDSAATAYANNLTETELRDMLAWSESPSGQSIRAKLPVVMQDMIASQAPMMKRLMQGATMKAVDRACDEAKCTSDQRKMIIAIAQKSMPPS